MIAAIAGHGKIPEQKFSTHSNVGRVGRWPFQIGGILNAIAHLTD